MKPQWARTSDLSLGYGFILSLRTLVCLMGLIWFGLLGMPALAADVEAMPASAQVLRQATLFTASGERVVGLPYALGPEDFPPDGGTVRFRLDWNLPSTPLEPQAAYVSRLSLSGRLFANGQLVGDCGNAPLPQLRCLHQPQFFRVPTALLHAGVNTLEFEVYATSRQTNGLSVVHVGAADDIHDRLYLPRHVFVSDLQVGLAWLSTLLGLLSLTVAMILRNERVFLWFGLTSVLNAFASLNGVVVFPLVNIDLYNWMIFVTRLVSVPMSFLTLLAIFGRDNLTTTRLLVGYSLFIPVAIGLSGNHRMLAFALYVPLVLGCPLLLYKTVRWSLASRAPIQATSTFIMFLLFGTGVVDWLRLGGLGSFDGIYLTAYSYSGMLITIGLLLLGRLAHALLQSQKMGAVLERQVAERIAYEVTENIPVGTFTVTQRRGFGRPRFSFLSRRFLQITGLDGQNVGRSLRGFLDIIHPEDRLEQARLFLAAWRDKQPFSARMRIMVQGHTHWINLESAPRQRADGDIVWEGVLIEETEQVLAREAADKDRAALQVHLLAQSRQQEREQLMRDVHDGFGSQLASVRMMVEKGRIPPEQLPDYLREISADLHLVVDTFGQKDITLEEALYDMRYRTERRFGAVGVQFLWTLVLQDMPPLSGRTILQILRIAQEAIHNAIRHARAKQIAVVVRYDAIQSTLEVAIEDDGQGMPSQPRNGRGIDNMRHRAREIGAQLAIDEGAPGTRVRLQLAQLG